MLEMVHSLGCWKLRIPKTAWAIPGACKATPEGNRIATERDLHTVNMHLAMCLPDVLTSYPFTVEEAKLGITVVIFEVSFVTAVHMVPSFSDSNANTRSLVLRRITAADFSPFNADGARRSCTLAFYRPQDILVCNTRIARKQRYKILKG
jgi:hypothetical protein